MWRNDTERLVSPVVIGGLGGSGTRVVAQILQSLDFYLGSYLNAQLDNLWFTFLMRRPASIRSFASPEIPRSLKLFDSIMKSYWGKSFKARTQLYEIAAEFILHNYVKRSRYRFPLHTVRSISQHHYHTEQHHWGWKEPNSHLFIEHLFELYPKMKFIMVMRHPLDMAYGNNFNQLYNWHHLFKLPKPNKYNERELMLRYYDASYTRAIETGERLLGSRFRLIKIEELCHYKQAVDELLEFLEVEPDAMLREQLYALPQIQPTFGRYKKHLINNYWKEAHLLCEKFNYEYR